MQPPPEPGHHRSFIMKIAIIGAGNVGTALATSLTQAGHDVVITSRDASDAAAAAAASGATTAPTNVDAVRDADAVIPAIYAAGLPELAAEIGDAVAGTPVIDVSNRLQFGESGPTIDTTTSNAEELAALLPKSPVVKAFNTLFAIHQVDPKAEGIALDGYVAGDDPAAKALVLDLVGSLGLEPVDVGPLARARQLEGLAFLNMTMNIANGGSWDSGWKLVGAPKPAATDTDR
jgi:predicted dinucleotide-binding enzyme